ncbi:MAG: hypothetical protein A2Y03_00760 [Omnitrophica WOR_2 bacterium GWF2_38_59]|nr:MAG: hypothetical protein A2Y03_00760 [Omnitrophica WOR_2 bacterium GWF2_38_59]OGX46886.1 MAG: hypothetical protein A2243_11880 [Omnitrophica WOR_2 bacterium RIFOXYA2_FULL_38_17]OGX52604.1 MAG: hypothetical protein A2267_03815 [Omnitrophica WOR_2 bacterium RIFOXYA12_FULL_38_10]OGX58505.1 MAG: hypothetical protein A2306_03715 [Omnitrophica WOR_2 bacterium RIFOXYB2_FULL_38_16]HBG60588.1 hypothetical protein [Candidatus Omnitrophota bacterium]
MKRVVISTVISALLFTGIAIADNNVEKINNSQADIALKWVNLIDEEAYDKSWDEAAAFFKQAVVKDLWVETVEKVRVPFGKVLKRDLIDSQYLTSLPGVPDGEYMVMQFAAEFEKKEKAIETITVMLDEDGEWRVAGYYIN